MEEVRWYAPTRCTSSIPAPPGFASGGILSDLFGANGSRILQGLVAGHSCERILASTKAPASAVAAGPDGANTTLREVLIECAHGAVRTHERQFRGYHKALTIRRGFKRAAVATAHKMLRVI